MTATIEKPAPSLSASDRADLGRLERVIDRAQESFRDLVFALREIHQRKLFKSEFFSWNDYCLKRWGFTRRYAAYLIQAARLIEECEAEGTTPPANQNQARRILNARRKPSISEPELLAKSIEEERPSVRRTREIERHLAELRDLHQGHPHQTKASELLRYYAEAILPWPDELTAPEN